MLEPGRREGLERDKALNLIAELQRLQRQDRRHRELVEQLRALPAAVDPSAGGDGDDAYPLTVSSHLGGDLLAVLVGLDEHQHPLGV
jgi:hypothetical protein